MKFYSLDMTEEEANFIIKALRDYSERLIDEIKDSEMDDEEITDEHFEQQNTLLNNVITNATKEIEILKEQLAERDSTIEEYLSKLEDKLEDKPQFTATRDFVTTAPYGFKKDGSPRKRPGRPSTKKGNK